MDDRLYKFSVLVEIGNFTRAAEELHISQPALSLAIQKLERELGVALLLRTGRRLELTPAGHAVYTASLEHQDVASNLRETLRRLSRKRPSVTIGMVDSVADMLCDSDAFERLEKQADVTIVVNNSRYLREGVERRKLDLAFTIDDELEHDGLKSEVVGEERLRLVFRQDLAEVMTASLQKKRLDNFISYDKPSTTYRHIHRFFTDNNIEVRARLYSTSPDVMLNLVLQGKGCAVLPERLVHAYLQDEAFISLLSPAARPIAVMAAVNKTLPPHLKTFLQEAKSLLH